MALTVESAEADRLAHRLAAVTGESLAEAVTNALRERLARQGAVEEPPRAVDEATREERRAALRKIREALAGKEIYDPRSDDEILGYNEYGTFD